MIASLKDFTPKDYEKVMAEVSKAHIELVDKLSKEDIDFFDDYDESDDIQYALYEYGICEYISEFTGEANTLRDDGLISWDLDKVTYYQGDLVCFVGLRFPTLFKQTYKDMDEIVDGLKYKLANIFQKILTIEIKFVTSVEFITVDWSDQNENKKKNAKLLLLCTWNNKRSDSH